MPNKMNFHRRFVTDLIDPNLIPADLHEPELLALEAERRRLTDVLEQIKRNAPRRPDSAAYIRERTQALSEGREPPPHPGATDNQEARAQHERDVKATEEALLALGDRICETVARHPEWQTAAERTIQQARDRAEALRRQADEAEQQAQDVVITALWLRRVADGELFVPHYQHPAADDDDRHIIIDIQDPAIRDLIAASRTGQPL